MTQQCRSFWTGRGMGRAFASTSSLDPPQGYGCNRGVAPVWGGAASCWGAARARFLVLTTNQTCEHRGTTEASPCTLSLRIARSRGPTQSSKCVAYSIAPAHPKPLIPFSLSLESLLAHLPGLPIDTDSRAWLSKRSLLPVSPRTDMLRSLSRDVARPSSPDRLRSERTAGERLESLRTLASICVAVPRRRVRISTHWRECSIRGSDRRRSQHLGGRKRHRCSRCSLA